MLGVCSALLIALGRVSRIQGKAQKHSPNTLRTIASTTQEQTQFQETKSKYGSLESVFDLEA